MHHGGGFCYSVISSRRYTPPRAPCEPQVCVFPLRAVFFFLASLMLTYLYFSSFFSSFPFSISIWTSFVFILSFSCGYYAVSSVSVSAATRLAYMYMYNCDFFVCFRTYLFVRAFLAKTLKLRRYRKPVRNLWSRFELDPSTVAHVAGAQSFFFSSRRRHTRSCLVSWARGCV